MRRAGASVCFDCHVNRPHNAATQPGGRTSPAGVPSTALGTARLRGVNIQRLFRLQRGAQRASSDFTRIRGSARAYFDGDSVIAPKKGLSILERRQPGYTFMAEFQGLLDFPPAPKLNVFGKLDPALATESRAPRQEVFFARPVRVWHVPARIILDNLINNLAPERFYKSR